MIDDFVPLNSLGIRIGQYHQRAKLSDHDVELIRQLAEQGICYKAIATKFEISWVTVGRICRFERRSQTIAKFKKLKVKVDQDG